MKSPKNIIQGMVAAMLLTFIASVYYTLVPEENVVLNVAGWTVGVWIFFLSFFTVSFIASFYFTGLMISLMEKLIFRLRRKKI